MEVLNGLAKIYYTQSLKGLVLQSTGDDAKDLAMLRAAKNIDDGPVSMKKRWQGQEEV